MKKVFSFFLVFALVFTLFVPAHSPFVSVAYADDSLIGIATPVKNVVPDDPESWTEWVARANHLFGSDGVSRLNSASSRAFSRYGYGEKSMEQLSNLAVTLSSWFNSQVKPSSGGALPFMDLVVTYDVANKVYRLIDNNTNIWFVYSGGQFPYVPSDDDSLYTFNWVREDRIGSSVHIMNDTAALAHVIFLAGDSSTASNPHKSTIDIFNDSFVCAFAEDMIENGKRFILCDPSGAPLAYIGDSAAINTPQDYYGQQDSNGDYTLGDSMAQKLLDMLEGSMKGGNGDTLYVDDVTYDMSSKTYNIDAHKEYSFDIENNTYIYYTYNYEYNYYINYTNVTYIGQTAEDKSYKYYYELPDGRSSADLTAEELEQLNTQIDVLPYVRSADDVSIRSLYHFDGDIHDSSYWNYCTSLDWLDGASITYLDAGAFGGCLYLDEKAHDFTFTLPSSLATSDFTIEFRYYQSATAAPATDSYIYLGSSQILSLSGDAFSFNGSTYATSVGQWTSLCFQRSGNTLSFYYNGVRKGSMSTTSFYDNHVRLRFGSSQQTFKYLDEFRVTSKALYGSSYTPSAVPFDTNLALVLPDSKIPVADGYWNVTCKNNLLSQYGLDNWVNFNASSNTHLVNLRSPDSAHLYKYNDSTYTLDLSQVPSVGYNPADTSHYSFTSEGVSFSRDGSYGDVGIAHTTRVSVAPGYACNMNFVNSGLVIPLGISMAYYNGSTSSSNYTLYPAGQYVFTVVLSDGTIVNFPVTVSAPGTRYEVFYNDIAGKNSGNLRIVSRIAYSNGSYYKNKYAVAINAISLYSTDGAATPPIVYMALEPGTTSTVTAEYIEDVVVMDKSDFNTPSLAVKTDVDITGWQIGGVRPSLPTKGLVWALVEDGYITSLQIYTGYAWQAVDGRIWTGERWIPYSSYNVVTLQDMFDIVDANSDKTYIYTESGFWRWLQTAWTGMTGQLNSILLAIQGLGGGSGSGSGAINPDPEAPDFPDSEDSSGEKWTVIELLGGVVDGVWVITTGVVNVTVDGVSGLVNTVGAAGDFFKAYNSDDPDSSLFGAFTYEGSDIWD